MPLSSIEYDILADWNLEVLRVRVRRRVGSVVSGLRTKTVDTRPLTSLKPNCKPRCIGKPTGAKDRYSRRRGHLLLPAAVPPDEVFRTTGVSEKNKLGNNFLVY